MLADALLDPRHDEACQSDESPAAAPEEEQWRPNPNPDPNPNPNAKPKPKPNPNQEEQWRPQRVASRRVSVVHVGSHDAAGLWGALEVSELEP